MEHKVQPTFKDSFTILQDYLRTFPKSSKINYESRMPIANSMEDFFDKYHSSTLNGLTSGVSDSSIYKVVIAITTNFEKTSKKNNTTQSAILYDASFNNVATRKQIALKIDILKSKYNVSIKNDQVYFLLHTSPLLFDSIFECISEINDKFSEPSFNISISEDTLDYSLDLLVRKKEYESGFSKSLRSLRIKYNLKSIKQFYLYTDLVKNK